MTLYRQPANLFVAGFIGSPPMNFFAGTVSVKKDALVFEEKRPHGVSSPQPITVLLDGVSVRCLPDYLGKRVVLGIRPEHIACGSPLSVPTPEHNVEATIELIQPLGSETYLHLAGHASPFIVRVPAADQFKVGQQVSLAFDAHNAHFFDPSSGTTIV
jgi:multiple sugar transport system ATP-binding protein